jgi:hypothetical protein
VVVPAEGFMVQTQVLVLGRVDIVKYLSGEDAYSFATSDPTVAFVGGPCCPTLYFVIAF